MVGQSVSHYRLIEKLGSGGMGEVYKAEDTRLKRTVALKLLPGEWGARDRDPERRRRLIQEARAASALDHPNVVTIYDVGEADGRCFIAMQLVSGKTLRKLIGDLSLREALGYAFQIAKGLSAAHARGIVHRDLKPENVIVAESGVVKILDFGLAKLSESPGFDSFETPTKERERPLTEEGHILGTPSYMSPEQASGKKVDARTDIFSFGSVLFEMLSGKRAFPGNTFAETAASLLEREPDWNALSAGTPPLLLRLLKRCLRKNVEERLHDAADASLELEEILSEISGGAAEPRRKRSRKVALAAAGIAALGLVALFLFRSRTPTAGSTDAPQPRFQLTLPRGVRIPALGASTSVLAISPNGERVAFVGMNAGGRTLYLRERHELDALPIPGTEGALCPFFSPDGRWLGFEAGGKLKKVALEGGAVQTIADDAPQLRGVSWGEDGTIVFSSGGRGLLQVPADGGEVRELTKRDPDRDRDHRWPHILPGGRAVLFVVQAKTQHQDVAVLDLATGSISVLVKGSSYPRYTRSKHLIYARAGVLYGAPFDVERLKLTGKALPVLEGVAMSSSPGGTGDLSGAASYDVALEGSLVFSPREARFPKRSLVWVDRHGRMEPLDPVARPYQYPALSPDGHRLAVGVIDADFQGTFILDIERAAWTRVNDLTGAGENTWMPDGEGVLSTTVAGLTLVSSSGAFQPERLYDGNVGFPDVAPDASAVLFCIQPAPAQWDIWRLPLRGRRVAEPFLTGPTLEVTPSFSPDGRWVAYSSNESGRNEIWVHPYPGPGPGRLVSIDRGASPRWSRDGTEIFFFSRGRLMSAAVRLQPQFLVELPRELFSIPEDIDTTSFYDVTADGKRFVMVRKDPFELRPLELVMIPNWIAELEARMAGIPTDR